jgi:hypothetical protein
MEDVPFLCCVLEVAAGLACFAATLDFCEFFFEGDSVVFALTSALTSGAVGIASSLLGGNVVEGII